MLWTLIPAKSFRHSKQRLATVLGEEARARLSAAMLARTVRTARAALGGQPVLVVTPDEEVAEAARQAGADRAVMASSEGLNAQLAEAAALVPSGDALLVLHGDLPLLEAGDLAAMAEEQAPVVIASDHAGTGTNALLLRTPDRFFAFGPGSCARHREEAQARGLAPAFVRREGLARDLDEPADWERLGLPLSTLLERLAEQDQSSTRRNKA